MPLNPDYPFSVLGEGSALNSAELAPGSRELSDCSVLGLLRRKVISRPALINQWGCQPAQGRTHLVAMDTIPPAQQILWLACLFSLGLRGPEAAWPVACCSTFCLEACVVLWRCCGCQPQVTLSALGALASLVNYPRTGTVQRPSARRWPHAWPPMDRRGLLRLF